MPDLFKELLPALMQTKANVFESDEEADAFYLKNSYMVNKALSMHLDCVIQANMMNRFWSLDGKLKHDFFMNVLRGYKRKFNYAKGEKMEDLNIVKEFYNVNNTKAKEYLSLLSNDQLETIRKKLSKGGVVK